MVTLVIEGKERQYKSGTTYEEIVKEYQPAYDNQIALVSINGKIRELFKKATKDGRLEFFTWKDAIGNKTYMRTATMMLMKAVHDVVGAEWAAKCRVEFTVGGGYYITVKGLDFTQELIDKLKCRMQELREQEMPLFKRSYSMDEAMELFHEKGMKDKEKLFKYRRSSFINIYEMDGYYDYFYGYSLPHAGYVKYYDLVLYGEGMMLLLPKRKAPDEVPEIPKSELLFQTLREAEKWGEKVNITTVGDLNDQICAGNISDMILVQEAEQERKIGEIAKEIVRRGNVKFIMIAGPSSSGKTSFSHRLSIQLRTQGMTPHPIGLDDYFVDREKTPRDENGDYNFECLGAIDVEQFNSDMCALLAGETVKMPSFNFKTGKREYKGNTLTLGAEDVLVIEGIHGLNEKMSYALPEESKYKIYISALTSLNIDEHNRIPTTDGRLLRRMVRDARTRGADAKRTIQMWPSVRRGEEENIFPFQESADAMFNSALIYELAVLKQFAEPLLFNISKDEPEYYEAKRLLKFLDYFLGVSSEKLPNNSICREFVGGSCFNV
ncbi:MAG: nucleoside kinase [Lachnospiraceae bacterium]|nr:nucleoside kinase [Lachnospiraceae bacterium]